MLARSTGLGLLRVRPSQASIVLERLDESSWILTRRLRFLFLYHRRYHWLTRQPSGYRAGLRRRRARVQIAVAALSSDSFRQTVHTHCASVH